MMERVNKQVRVVIVDDCEIDLVIFRSVLQKLGLSEVASFQYSVDCLEYLNAVGETEWPSHLFVDLNMPGINGFEFISQCLNIFNTQKPVPKIYILTSSNNPEDRKAALNYKCVDSYLLKPITVEAAELVLFQ